MRDAVALGCFAFGLMVGLEAVIFAYIKLSARVEAITEQHWWTFPPMAVAFVAIVLGVVVGSASLAFAVAHWAFGV